MPDIPSSPGTAQSDIALSRIYLPFAMVVAFGAFLVVAGYSAGSLMSGLSRDKSEMESRLASIERDLTTIKGILSERNPCRPK